MNFQNLKGSITKQLLGGIVIGYFVGAFSGFAATFFLNRTDEWSVQVVNAGMAIRTNKRTGQTWLWKLLEGEAKDPKWERVSEPH